jgi:hypothetical protein
VSTTSDHETDAFLQLADPFDAETNTVAHAVARAQATLRSIIEETRALLDWLTYAPKRGLLAFTVPGMHAFIARQP